MTDELKIGQRIDGAFIALTRLLDELLAVQHVMDPEPGDIEVSLRRHRRNFYPEFGRWTWTISVPLGMAGGRAASVKDDERVLVTKDLTLITDDDNIRELREYLRAEPTEHPLHQQRLEAIDRIDAELAARERRAEVYADLRAKRGKEKT
jgi:hypothetical protein